MAAFITHDEEVRRLNKYWKAQTKNLIVSRDTQKDLVEQKVIF